MITKEVELLAERCEKAATPDQNGIYGPLASLLKDCAEALRAAAQPPAMSDPSDHPEPVTREVAREVRRNIQEWKPGDALACIVCTEPLDNVGGDNQPYGGLAFATHGHYGSTIFDPLPSEDDDGDWLVVNICDDCLKAAGKAGLVLHYDKPAPPPAEPKLWNGAT